MTNEDYTVADYLVARLSEIGVRHLFGVPGDYNLAFLDHVITAEGIRWVGNANELNAAYAADGYARLNGMSALLTTYGVGELSALNGVAGAYAEHLPVIHIVGAPASDVQSARRIMHHTLGDGDYGHFARAYQEVTVAQAVLRRVDAEQEIDRVLAMSVYERRPGYLLLPVDVAAAPATPPETQLTRSQAPLDAAALAGFRAHAQQLLAAAESVTVLGDLLLDRFGAAEEVRQLCNTGGFPWACLVSGKTALPEDDAQSLGMYLGAASSKAVRSAVEDADVLIQVGVQFSDGTTANFSQQIAPEDVIDIQPFETTVAGQPYGPLPMRVAVQALTAAVADAGIRRELATAELSAAAAAPSSAMGPLTQTGFWQQIQEFLLPDDLVVADLGTSFWGAALCRMPAGARFLGQVLWGSIGYSVPSAFGAQIAAPDRRCLLFVGDGAAQLTVQEIGSMIRTGQRPIIFLLNNRGYTIERLIRGPHERYNDIAPWDWRLLPAALGGGRTLTLRAGTPAELSEALRSAEQADQLVLLEVVLDMLDAPDALHALAESVADAMA